MCVHVQLHGQMHTYADVPSVLVHSHHAMHSTNYGGQNLFDVAFQIFICKIHQFWDVHKNLTVFQLILRLVLSKIQINWEIFVAFS